jgi:hypothetical protein
MEHGKTFGTYAACEEQGLAHLEDVGLGACNRAQSLSNEVRNLVQDVDLHMDLIG